MDVTTQAAWPVYSAAGANEVYLEMMQQGERLKVMPTELGRKKLNGRLWPLWLQTLLLTKASPKHSYGVELSGKYVFVASSGSLQEMRYTVASLAAQIYPLEPVLVLQSDDGPKSGVIWHVRDGGRRLPMALLVDGLKLPSGASVSFFPNFSGSYWEMRLLRENSCRTPLRELMRSVELQFALSCARS